NGMTRPLVPLFALALGGTPVIIGVVVAVSDFLPIFLSLWVGMLADRSGPRRLILAGAVLLAVSTAIRALVPDLGTLTLGQAVLGLSQLFFFLAAQSYVARLGTPEDRAHQFGMWTFAASAGMLAGPILGGSLVDALVRFDWSQVDAFRWTFAVSGTFAVFAAVLALRLKEVAREKAEPERQLPDRQKGRGLVPQAAHLMDEPSVQAGAVTSFALALSISIRRSFYPIYLAGLGMSTSTVTILFSAHPLASMLVRPFLGPLTRWLGSGTLVIIGLVLVGVSWAMLPFSSTVLVLFFLASLGGVGNGIGSTVTMVMVTEGARPSERGLALGIRQMMNRIGDTVAPPVFGLIAGAAGMAMSFWTAGAFALVGLLPFALRRPRAASQDEEKRAPLSEDR
ncbi:MAG: MFS transporter, partial [Thermaerobacterales bacterium]